MPVPRGVALRVAKETGRDANTFPGQSHTVAVPAGQDSWGAAAWGQDAWGQAGQDSWTQQSWGSQAQQTWPQDATQGGDAQAQEAQTNDVNLQQMQFLQAQLQQSQMQQAQELQMQETSEQQLAPASTEEVDPSQPPDLSGIQLQPASWTHAVFDQTARELWQRLQEEGHPPEVCTEMFQSHMVAVYTQMQTQQQYEAIADTNASVTQLMDSLVPQDPLDKLKPLCKGDEKEPHRTCLGIDPLMKYHEHQKNAPHGIFIGGLRTCSNEDVLVKYFSKFGEVSFVEVKRLPDRTSRGFAFLHYSSEDPCRKVLQDKDNHMIDGKMVSCKKREPLEFTKPPDKKLKDMSARRMEEANMLSASFQSTMMNMGAYGSSNGSHGNKNGSRPY